MPDLSKAIGCLDHKFRIAKLHAYGYDYKSLKLVQRVRVNSSYISWADILSDVPQGSIGGPTIFNIYLIDIFMSFEVVDIANYADDTNPYRCGNDIDIVIIELKNDAKILNNWVQRNFMKANPDKFHVMLTDNDNNLTVKVDYYKVHNRGGEKLLGIFIDNKLSFNEHISSLWKKANQNYTLF